MNINCNELNQIDIDEEQRGAEQKAESSSTALSGGVAEVRRRIGTGR